MSLLRTALVTVPLLVLLGALSGRLSGSGHGNAWFDALIKPTFMPPGWAFGAAWMILYALLGLVLAMILHARGARGRRLVLAVFIVQLVLNYSWPPVFFAFHQTVVALVLIVLMIGLSAAAAALLWWIRPAAALLMLPYIAWLGFATALSFELIRLNPDAAELVPGGSSSDIILEPSD